MTYSSPRIRKSGAAQGQLVSVYHIYERSESCNECKGLRESRLRFDQSVMEELSESARKEVKRYEQQNWTKEKNGMMHYQRRVAV